MAVLIPRKQIEEQQDFIGSISIGGDLSVSGSLFVSQSFDFGSNVNDVNTITGSVLLTGSLTIDGDFNLENPDIILNATASQAIQSHDTFRYGGILARDFGANVPTLYVSSTDGLDTNDGRSIQFPVRTVKRACQLATPGFDGRYGLPSGSLFSGYVIRVQAGTYIENNPVILPKNTSIWGSGLRITKINALNKDQDLFYVNSGCYIAEVTMGGLRLWPDEKEPERGFAVAFQPGAFITTSPYIQNCSHISNQENSFTELYEEIPPGGGGLYVNGDVVHPDSPLASMVLDAYTQISPNGVGCLVNGRGFIQLVSFFTNFAYYAIRVNNGGHATLNNSNISFGLYGMYASGSRKIDAIAGGNEDARLAVRESYSVIVDVLNKGLEAGLPSITKLNTDGGIKVTPFTQSFSNDLATEVEVAQVSEDFRIISEIIQFGPSEYPPLIAKSGVLGYSISSPFNISAGEQFSSSISASASDLETISGSYSDLLSIFADGTGSFTFKSNTDDAIKVGNLSGVFPTFTTLTPNDSNFNKITSSFETVIKLVSGEISPTLISNTSHSIYLSETAPILPQNPISGSIVNTVSSSFSIIYNILNNGTGSPILEIPEDHQREFVVSRGVNDSAWVFDGSDENPDLTLFRGEKYKFNVSGSIGKFTNRFFIRTEPISGLVDELNYNTGVINNGDDFGLVTFTVPFNAPEDLYYVSQNSPNMVGKISIVNNVETPFSLIEGTMTYPTLIQRSETESTNTQIISASGVLNTNLDFIKNETIEYISSSWAGFDYDETVCKRDIGFIVDAVVGDLVFGGNSGSIAAGLEYYLQPSMAIGSQKQPTLTAVKYLSGLSLNLLKSEPFQFVNIETEGVYDLRSSIINSKAFIEGEVIEYLSSSWSEFDYDSTLCKRDIGFILNAVATDLLYGGNERSVTAGKFYFELPSEATDSQLTQTVDGIRYAYGAIIKVLEGIEHTLAQPSTNASVQALRKNRSLIQNETIEFINATFPTLDYNQSKCRRDVGFIIDGVLTDLLYGGNERSVKSGRFYYQIPSIATTLQRKETVSGIQYSKVLVEYIVQNILLKTPTVSLNSELGIKITNEEFFSSSISGSEVESEIVNSNFSVIGDIIRGGLVVTDAAIAKNKRGWNFDNLFNVTDVTQLFSDEILEDFTVKIGDGFNTVAGIIGGTTPQLIKSTESLTKINDIEQITGSFIENVVTQSISASFSTVVNIISNGIGVLPPLVLNTNSNIFVGNLNPITSSIAYTELQPSISSSFSLISDIISGGLSVLPEVIKNTENSIYVGNIQPFTSSLIATNTEVAKVSSSFAIVLDIIENGTGSLPALIEYTTASTAPIVLNVYNSIKTNIPFIQNEVIAYLSSSWSEFIYNEASYIIDIGVIVSGVAEDLLFNANSSSIANGITYYELLSSAIISGSGSVSEGAELLPTLDAIRYANELTIQLIQNEQFVRPINSKVEVGNILFNNKEFIRNETIEYISSSWSLFNYDDGVCKRDIGFIIDAVRTDLVYGGNQRGVTVGEYYHLIPSLATTTQLIQTIDAIEYTSLLSQQLISGVLFIQAEPQKLEASRLLLKNNELIASEVVSYVSSSWSEVVYNEVSCSRDVKYIIDAVRTDLVYGGNQRSITAGEFYFLFPSRATIGGVPSEDAQLDPTVTGIEYGSELAQKIVLSNLLELVSASKLDTYEVVYINKELIKENTIAYINNFFPLLNYNKEKCSRDVGFILDGVLTDLVYGGNQRSITSGKFYFRFPSIATSDQKAETIDGIIYAGELVKVISVNTILPSIEIQQNIDNTIKVTSAPQITSSISGSQSDINFISTTFDVILDIIENGTGSYEPTPYGTASSDVNTLSAYSLLRDNIPFIQSEAIEYISSSWGDFGYNEASCSRDIGFIVSGAAEDLLYGVVSASIVNGKFYYEFPSSATISGSSSPNTEAQLFPTLDGIRYAGRMSEKIIQNILFVTASSEISASVELLRNNRAFIQKETIEYVSSSWSQVVYNELSCSRDVGFLVDAVTTDLLYGGEERTVNAGDFYYKIPSRATVAGIPSEASQLDPTLSGVRYAGQISSRIVLGKEFTFASQSVISGRNLLITNKEFIQKETIAYLSSSWSNFDYNQVSCSRDIGFIIDAVATDLVYGGNESSIKAGTFYYLIPSVAIIDSYSDNLGQRQQTVDGINFSRGLSMKVVNQTQLVFPGEKRRDAVDRLLNAKEELKQRALSYTNGAFPALVYNEASCSRDTGFIVDAIATDLLYGGNERGIIAASSYYNGQFGSAATVVTNQRLETLETNRYLRTRAEFIAANAPKEDFGSLIVATGIDYSYNGSGVTFKALPPNQGGRGVPNPDFEITELGGGRIFFTSGNQDGDFRIGTGLSINQATGTLVGRTFSKSLFSLVTPFSLALEG